MLDFLMISTRSTKRGIIEIYPKFIIGNSKDLMIRGRDFYAVWDESKKLWTTNEQDVIELIDAELDAYAKINAPKFDDHVIVKHMWDAESGVIDSWHKFCQKQLRDNYKPLDENIIFADQITKKSDYASKKLTYSLENSEPVAYNKLMSILYSDSERRKIEWAIGSIVTGASKKLQKFLVLYGAPGTGKGTLLSIVDQMFECYSSVFDAEALGSANDSFALEQFKTNPLVAISYDSDLSHIEKNTRINSLVSHEKMQVNEKYKSAYEMKFNSFLLLGTNKPVKITDAKSGIIRRLIDVYPTGDKIPMKEYETLMEQINFELGKIANQCKQVFLEDPHYYDNYIPTLMMGESNDFYNFVLDSYQIFKKDNGVSLNTAWKMYKVYCEEAKVPYPFSKRIFASELKNYFTDYKERVHIGDEFARSYYSGFKSSIFDQDDIPDPPSDKEEKKSNLIEFSEQPSHFDILCELCPAQYSTASGIPQKPWADVKSTLSELDTHQLHYVKIPENHIVIDFDIKDEDGNKSFERNLKEASKWPKTYAELSKSGGGIHLHYIYTGDPTKLSKIYTEDIEIKVFTGNSSLRRKLTKCNNEPINTISSGLPLREEDKMINFEAVKNEKALRTIIRKNLNKEYHPATKPSIDFIYKVLDDCYNNGMKYDVTDMYNIILAFAASSTNNADYCIKLVSKMKFRSDEPSDAVNNEEQPIVFYDVEVFPNLFLVNWKFQGKGKKVVRMINPEPSEIESLLKYRLVGFNNRRYDNHMLYARLIGKSNIEIFNLSQRIINKERDAFFGEAYNISYTDIYDYCNAGNKMSLKKWEIKLGIHHQELGLPWDQPVPENLWEKVAEYCDNDVISTEAVWDATQGDFTARMILADIAGMTVNDTTNSLTIRIVLGNDKEPELNYVDLSEEFPGYEFKKEWNNKTQTYDKANMYRGIDLGFGGYVDAIPGMYGNAALLDIESLHPSTTIAINYLGKYTKNYADLKQTRVYIKHKQYDEAKKLFDGKLTKYLTDTSLAKDLSKALKTAINALYGLTSAKFKNPFRHPKNENNIIALRGALFMKTLQDEVIARGYKVIHIKTDSIKIPDATPEIINFCMSFAKMYGYKFEHEATYEKICLVNDAVYIAKYATKEQCEKLYGYAPEENEKAGGEWTATGTQFAVPYVYKSCFTHEPIEFRDLCETKEVNTAMYLNMNEGMEGEGDDLKFIGKVGLFCPIKEGCGGGELLANRKKKDGSMGLDAVTGTKGYRWLESEEVYDKHLEDNIDMSYYNKLVDQAVDSINTYGDYEWFVSNDPYIPSTQSLN